MREQCKRAITFILAGQNNSIKNSQICLMPVTYRDGQSLAEMWDKFSQQQCALSMYGQKYSDLF